MYTVEDTFNALIKAIKKLDGYTVDRIDDKCNIIYIKAGVSLFSWGENIEISVKENKNKTSLVEILSSPKTGIMFGGAMDMGKNRKNISQIINALSNELKEYNEIVDNDCENIYDEIEKLSELKNKGIITEEEFDKRKKKLLGI